MISLKRFLQFYRFMPSIFSSSPCLGKQTIKIKDGYVKELSSCLGQGLHVNIFEWKRTASFETRGQLAEVVLCPGFQWHTICDLQYRRSRRCMSCRLAKAKLKGRFLRRGKNRTLVLTKQNMFETWRGKDLRSLRNILCFNVYSSIQTHASAIQDFKNL